MKKLQPILSTEWPTGAVMRAGSLWPSLGITLHLTRSKKCQRNAFGGHLKRQKKMI